MKVSGLIIILMICCNSLFAQGKVFTLQKAIDTALQNNLLVNQRILAKETSEIDWKQSKLNMLPNVNGYSGFSYNQGKKH